MAGTRLTSVAFVAKWLVKFATNGIRAITGTFMREFAEDIAASFYNLADHQDIQPLDTSGANIAIDMLSRGEIVYLGSVSIGGNKTVTIPNATYAKEFTVHATSGGAYTLDFPANTSMRQMYHAGIWDNTNKVLTLEAGDFVIRAFYNGTTWRLEYYGPY